MILESFSKKRKAFTLLEIIVVMGVIAVLFSLGVYGILVFQKNSRDSSRINKGEEIIQLINDYRKATLRYPSKNDVVFSPSQVQIGSELSTNLTGHLTYSIDNTSSDRTRYYYDLHRSGFLFCVLLESNQIRSLGTGTCPPVSNW